MKGTKKIIRVSLIVALIFFSLSIATLYAKSEESAENKKEKENKTKEIITVSITPKAEAKKSQGSSKPFSLKKSENYKSKLNLNLNKKSDFNKKNEAVDYDFNQYLQGKAKSNKFEQSLFTSTLVTLVALNIADYFSTKEALKYEGLTEGNPIMKPFVKNSYAFAAVKIGMTVITSTYLHKLHKKSKTMAWALSVVSNFALSYVVANNIRLINKVK